MAGSILVTSAAGKGARFELRVPCAKVSTPARSARPEPSAMAAPRVKLLLVEDDGLVRRSLARWLAAEGFEVITAADGGKALEILATEVSIACVISDISMPNVDGEQLAAALAERYPKLPLLLVSGDRAPLGPILSQPRRAFVPKPLTQKAVVDALAGVLSDLA
jgi:CheY-like chemotaxis protein